MSGWRGVLIGCGFFARNHMHGWAEADGAEIVAVCDRDRARAESFATDFGAAAWDALMQPSTTAAAMRKAKTLSGYCLMLHLPV